MKSTKNKTVKQDKMYLVVVEYAGKHVGGPFEKKVSSFINGGSGFSFLSGNRDLTRFYKTERGANNAVILAKNLAKTFRVKIKTSIEKV